MTISLLSKYHHKVKTAAELRSLLGAPPRDQKVIMCHGVFDIVHPGHIRHLMYAKSKAPILIASLTADRHIEKGKYRPHVPQDLRALNLAALEPVDYVVIDAPVSLGLGAFDWERTMLRQVDVLLVAVTAEASGLGGVLRYLNAITAAKNNGALPSTFDAHVVLTGRDEDGTRSLLTERDIDRKLRGIPVIASVPQREPGWKSAGARGHRPTRRVPRSRAGRSSP